MLGLHCCQRASLYFQWRWSNGCLCIAGGFFTNWAIKEACSELEATLCRGARALGTWASVIVACRLRSCNLRAPEQGLSSCGLVAPWHVGSSPTRDRNKPVFPALQGGFFLLFIYLFGCTGSNLDSILKSRHYFANKGLSSQGYGFSSSHVRVGL